MGIDLHGAADAGTGRAGAEGAVEGKEMGLDFRQAHMAVGAGEMLAEGQHLVRTHAQDMDDAAGQLGRRFQRIGQAGQDAVLNNQPVDDHVDRVLLILVQGNIVRQQIYLSVDADADIAVPHQAGQHLLMRSLAAVDDGSHDHDLFPRAESHDGVGHLLDRLLADRLSALRAVGVAYAGVEQAQVVVDFRDCAYSRAGIAARRLLVDGNSRRQAFDIVDVGLVHLS